MYRILVFVYANIQKYKYCECALVSRARVCVRVFAFESRNDRRAAASPRSFEDTSESIQYSRLEKNNLLLNLIFSFNRIYA